MANQNKPQSAGNKGGYEVLENVKHDGVAYGPGDTIPRDKITAQQAANLRKRGVLK